MSARSKLNNGNYLYWLNENGRKIKGRFLRQELFALKYQFVQSWNQFISILKKHL